jgi:hypothetical protein
MAGLFHFDAIAAHGGMTDGCFPLFTYTGVSIKVAGVAVPRNAGLE